MSRRIRVTGHVQGVWYRGWTVDLARSLGHAGWVRNRSDGSVEILADGDAAALDALVDRCREGPPAARVGSVTVTEDGEPAPPGFTQRPTA
jgi:acylphosphatase